MRLDLISVGLLVSRRVAIRILQGRLSAFSRLQRAMTSGSPREFPLGRKWHAAIRGVVCVISVTSGSGPDLVIEVVAGASWTCPLRVNLFGC